MILYGVVADGPANEAFRTQGILRSARRAACGSLRRGVGGDKFEAASDATGFALTAGNTPGRPFV